VGLEPWVGSHLQYTHSYVYTYKLEIRFLIKLKGFEDQNSRFWLGLSCYGKLLDKKNCYSLPFVSSSVFPSPKRKLAKSATSAIESRCGHWLIPETIRVTEAAHKYSSREMLPYL